MTKIERQFNAAETAIVDQLRDIADLGTVASAAQARLVENGLPSRRVEEWHYTDLRMLLKNVPSLAGRAGDALPLEDVGEAGQRLSLVNGFAPQGASMIAASEVPQNLFTFAEGNALVDMNRALGRDALFLQLGDGDVSVLDHSLVGEAGHSVSSSYVQVAAGAKATLIEVFTSSDAAHLSNVLTTVSIGDGAEFMHQMIVLSAAQSVHFGTANYTIGSNAKLQNMIFHRGPDLVRSQIFANFIGEGSHADIAGANLVSDGQHADITLLVNHGVANTTSTESFKNVVDGRARAIFQGKINVAPDAQKVDAKMMTQALLLSARSEALFKPELEIFADDVICGHGATCGEIDEDALFYLMARGIARDEAEAMLIRAFVVELFDLFEDEHVRETYKARVDVWLNARSED